MNHSTETANGNAVFHVHDVSKAHQVPDRSIDTARLGVVKLNSRIRRSEHNN